MNTMKIDAAALSFEKLNALIRDSREDAEILNCCGQRFIGSGMAGKSLTIHGTPGNALGAYLNGGSITVYGNVQDAVGDTMDSGSVTVFGDAGDALGYAMRGGKIYIRGNSGYRTGIHMKEYGEKRPVIIIGGSAGSFLGEYLAGGLIVVLGLGCGEVPLGNFTGTGMHGGRIIVRSPREPENLPPQVSVTKADEALLTELRQELREYLELFSIDPETVFDREFYLLSPNTKNPYKKLYTPN